MGKLKDAHDHALTQWLKVIIFGIVMLAPFFAILSKCMYVTCNKNAYESYYGETINEFNIISIENTNEIKNNEKYFLSTNNSNYSTGVIENLNYFICENVNYMNTKYNNVRLGFYNSNSNPTVLTIYARDLTDLSNVLFTVSFNNSNVSTINFIYTSYVGLDNPLLSYIGLYYKEYNKLSYLDNVFEYSVSQLGETPIFAWTKNTGIYTPINNMTTGLGFDADNNTLAILLTYWALNTAIYIVFDIMIVLFVKLTHFVNGN